MTDETKTTDVRTEHTDVHTRSDEPQVPEQKPDTTGTTGDAGAPDDEG